MLVMAIVLQISSWGCWCWFCWGWNAVVVVVATAAAAAELPLEQTYKQVSRQYCGGTDLAAGRDVSGVGMTVASVHKSGVEALSALRVDRRFWGMTTERWFSWRERCISQLPLLLLASVPNSLPSKLR